MKTRLSVLILFWLAGVVSPAFSVVINEIMYNPDISALYEYVELYNPADTPEDIGNFNFSKGIDYRFPAGTTIPANGFIVLMKDPGKEIGLPAGIETFGPYDGKLSNSGEKLTLKNSAGQTVESFTYSDDPPWATGADGYGGSLERISPALAAADYHSWRASTVKNGTPGQPNSIADIPERPLVRSCTFSPQNPGSGQSVVVTVELDSPDLIQSVTLQQEILQGKLRLGGPLIPMQRLETTTQASRWTAELPPVSSQSLVRVNFLVQRTDNTTLVLPHAGERRPFFSYFCFDNEIESRLPILWLFPYVKSGLVPLDSSYVGAVILENSFATPQVFDAVHRRRSEAGYKIKFIKGEEYQGNRTLNLIPETSYEAGGTSGAPAPFFEQLGFKFFKRMGVLSPGARWFRIIDYQPLPISLPKPDGAMTQQILIQQPNENFLELNNRDSEGNIYKLLWYTPIPEKKTNLDEGSEDLQEIMGLNSITDSTARYQELDRMFFLEDVISYEAASMLTSNWDGYHNNMFWYHDLEGSGKWEIIPWDLDKIWGFTDENPMFTRLPLDFPLRGRSEGVWRETGPIAPAVHRDGLLDRQYRERVAFELNHLFSMDTLFSWIATDEALLLNDLELIESQLQHTRPKRREQIIASYQHIREFIKLRHQYLREEFNLPVDQKYFNDPPQILKIFPGNTEILAFPEDSTLFFEITARDLQGTELAYSWILNGDSLTGANSNSLQLHARDCSGGMNHLTAYVADEFEYEPVVWQIQKDQQQGVDDNHDLPLRNQLFQNYPNPFNAQTTIHFQLAKAAEIRLEIFNALGQRVSVPLYSKLASGNHQQRIDFTRQASGLYFVRLRAGKFIQTRKILLLR